MSNFHIIEINSHELESGTSELILGWHYEKERLVIWVNGSEKYGLLWFDSLFDDGFMNGLPPQFKNECIHCNTELMRSPTEESQMFYYGIYHVTQCSFNEHQYTIDFLSTINLEGNRVWSVNPYSKYELITCIYVCENCENQIMELARSLAQQNSEIISATIL